MNPHRLNTIPKNFQVLFLILILLNVAACTTTKVSRTIPEQSNKLFATDVPLYGEVLVKTELIFGLSRPNGDLISEAEWQKFLDDYITPRFKEGLTVIEADGQYLTQSNEVIKERAKIVILLYESTEKINASIEYIRSSYKQIFKQESVLRISTPAGVSF